MNDKRMEIVILGGSMAASMVAAYLTRYSFFSGQVEPKITLIEDSGFSSQEMEEATLPHIKRFVDDMGLNRNQWLRDCNGTFRLGTQFVNWSGRGDDVYNYSLQSPPQEQCGFSSIEYWIEEYLRTGVEPSSLDFSIGDFLMKKKKAPLVVKDEEVYDYLFPYGYHIDVESHRGFCRRIALSRNLTSISDTIKGVSLHPNGDIACLHSEVSGDIFGDLFIDCSGPSRELLGKVYEEPCQSYSDSLLCDRAVVLHSPPRKVDEKINPYSIVSALNAGWVREVPLFDKSSFGYVYSSSFIGEEEAERELRDFLGAGFSQVEAKHLSFTSGRLRNFWVKNCVAVGAAGGFIDPLESSGLHLTQMGVENIVNFLPEKGSDPFLAEQYNRVMDQEYNEIFHFTIAHYCTTGREDTAFWKANKHDLVIPQALQDNLERWKRGWLARSNMKIGYTRRFGSAFGHDGYLRVLSGMRYLPDTLPGMVEGLSSSNPGEKIRALQKTLNEKAEHFSDQTEYLKNLIEVAGIQSSFKMSEESFLKKVKKGDYESLFSLDNFINNAKEANSWLDKKKAAYQQVIPQDRLKCYLYRFEIRERKAIQKGGQKSPKYAIFFKCPKVVSSAKLKEGMIQRLDSFFQWKPDPVPAKSLSHVLRSLKRSLDNFFHGGGDYQFLDLLVEEAYRKNLAELFSGSLFKDIEEKDEVDIAQIKKIVLKGFFEADNDRVRNAMKESAEGMARKEMFAYVVSRFLEYPVVPPCSLASFEIEDEEIMGLGQLYTSGGFNGTQLMSMPLSQRIEIVKKIKKPVFDMCIVLGAMLMNCDANMSNVYFFLDGHLALLDNFKVMPLSNTSGIEGRTLRHWLLSFPQAEIPMNRKILLSITRWDISAIMNLAEEYFSRDCEENRRIKESFEERLRAIKEICENALADEGLLVPKEFIFRLYPDLQERWKIVRDKGYPLVAVASMSGSLRSELIKLEEYDPEKSYTDNTGLNYESPPFLTMEEFESFQKTKMSFSGK